MSCTERVYKDETDSRSHFAKCYKIKNLTDEESTLLEPASCAIHGMDKLKMPFGAKVLLIGAGPTGLILAQLMKMGGAGHITIAANKGTWRGCVIRTRLTII